jgi:hypothetical protein
MDSGTLMASLLFGLIGMAMFMYGKKAGRLVPLIVGVVLMVVPYFIANFIAMLIVCSAITSIPWFLREA